MNRGRAKQIRLWLGLVFPGLAVVPVLLAGVSAGEGGVTFVILLLGPFLVYYLGATSVGFSIGIGVALDVLAAYALVPTFTETIATGGDNLYWLGLLGYPIAVVGVALDRYINSSEP